MKKLFMLFMASALTVGFYSCKQAAEQTEEVVEETEAATEEVVEEATEAVEAVADSAAEVIEEVEEAVEDHTGHGH